MEIVRLTAQAVEKWKGDICFLLKEAVVNNFPNSIIEAQYYTEKVDELKAFLKDDKACAFVAKEIGQVIGLIWCHDIKRFDEKRLHIAMLAVNPKEKGKGIGRQLLNEAESYACVNGYKGVDLLVSANNTRAVGFYEINDFKTERLLLKKDI